jgi:hypothetical protein
MTRLGRLIRPRVDVYFCDECARLDVCDAACYADRARQAATTRALRLGMRL